MGYTSCVSSFEVLCAGMSELVDELDSGSSGALLPVGVQIPFPALAARRYERQLFL